jgi:hypothetical protein
MKKRIPPHFQGLLWTKNINKLDIKKDKNYIIHNVLMYGTFSDIKWLIEVYSINVIILRLKKTELNEEEYIKTLY